MEAFDQMIILKSFVVKILSFTNMKTKWAFCLDSRSDGIRGHLGSKLMNFKPVSVIKQNEAFSPVMAKNGFRDHLTLILGNLTFFIRFFESLLLYFWISYIFIHKSMLNPGAWGSIIYPFILNKKFFITISKIPIIF